MRFDLFKNHSKKKLRNIRSTVVYENNFIDNIYLACTCCYDNTKKDITTRDKLSYIGKRVKAGHDSILEHGTLIIAVHDIPKDINFYEDYINAINNDSIHYLHVYDNLYTRNSTDNKTFDIIIGGSIRGWKHYISKKINYVGNVIVDLIITRVFKSVPIEFFVDLIDKNESVKIATKYCKYEDKDLEYTSELDYINNTGLPSYDSVYDKPFKYGKKEQSFRKSICLGIDISKYLIAIAYVKRYDFETNILFDMIPVMVEFTNISRTATHQLVRHRNAITQESQRYVDYSNATFTTPEIDYIGTDKMFDITDKYKLPFDEIGDKLMSIYSSLLSQGIKKEDARAFLPSNVNCGRLYMTFTISSLIKFLELRTDKHAQLEIRKYALSINSVIDGIKKDYSGGPYLLFPYSEILDSEDDIYYVGK